MLDKSTVYDYTLCANLHHACDEGSISQKAEKRFAELFPGVSEIIIQGQIQAFGKRFKHRYNISERPDHAWFALDDLSKKNAAHKKWLASGEDINKYQAMVKAKQAPLHAVTKLKITLK